MPPNPRKAYSMTRWRYFVLTEYPLLSVMYVKKTTRMWRVLVHDGYCFPNRLACFIFPAVFKYCNETWRVDCHVRISYSHRNWMPTLRYWLNGLHWGYEWKNHFGKDFCNSSPMAYTYNSSFLKQYFYPWSRNRYTCTLIDQQNVKTYRIFKTCLVILNMFLVIWKSG